MKSLIFNLPLVFLAFHFPPYDSEIYRWMDGRVLSVLDIKFIKKPMTGSGMYKEL